MPLINSAGKTNRIKVCFLISLLLAISACTPTPVGDASPSVERIASQFGVPSSRVLDLAHTLGVAPDKLDAFGPYWFPYNYFENQLTLYQQQHGRPPTKSEVEGLFKGYVAKCELTPPTIEYLYYSTNVHQSFIRQEIALVITVTFQRPKPNQPALPDPPLVGIQPVGLRDGSVNPPSETYWERCVQDYLSKPKTQTP